jgi:hypothetical protein
MLYRQNKYSTRRRFLSNGLRLAGLSALLLPLQKTVAARLAMINTFPPLDRLVLNTKTGVVHLPAGRIFSKYPTIRRRTLIGSATWETEMKPTYHFNKEKSGIIIEVLALSRLAGGITDKSLNEAYRILSIAFTVTYKNKSGVSFNKYNFRLHHLLLYAIAMNNTIPLAQKWEKFQVATSRIDYSLKDTKPLPQFMSWLKSKAEFDKKVNYILQNKQEYSSRLVKRANRYKL